MQITKTNDLTNYQSAAVYVAAFYNNMWYFWDQTKAPTNRWVAIPNINVVSSFPEVSVSVTMPSPEKMKCLEANGSDILEESLS